MSKYTFKTIINKIISPRMRKSFIIISIIVVLIAGSGGFYIYRTSTRSNDYFLQILKEYEFASDIEFKNAWVQIITKTKTPTHYLMLLKRLDRRNLDEEYSTTLVRALWKYPKIHSFTALLVDYTLEHGKRNVFEDALLQVDDLWNDYPNLLRLYYIEEYDTKRYKYQGDVILSSYYSIKENINILETLDILAQITEDPMFLYFTGIKSVLEGKRESAQILYDRLPIEWKNIYLDHYIQFAWLVGDTDVLSPIVESSNNVDEHITLSTIYAIQDNIPEAYSVLIRYKTLFPEEKLPYSFIELQLWYEKLLYAKNNLTQYESNVLDINDVDVYRKYMIALFQEDRKMLVDFISRNDGILSGMILQDDMIKFLYDHTDASISHSYITSELWKILYKKQNTDSVSKWLEIAATYFLENAIYEEYILLEEKYQADYQELFMPYQFYYALLANDTYTVNTLKNNIPIHIDREYPWWYYYNLGVMTLNTREYQQAEFFLTSSLQQLHDINISYKQYPLSQLVRVYIALEDMVQAETYLEELKHLFPVNVYRDMLELSLENKKKALEVSAP